MSRGAFLGSSAAPRRGVDGGTAGLDAWPSVSFGAVFAGSAVGQERAATTAPHALPPPAQPASAPWSRADQGSVLAAARPAFGAHAPPSDAAGQVPDAVLADIGGLARSASDAAASACAPAFLGPTNAAGCVEPPDDFVCPITLDLMADPVRAADGKVYDRSAITQWIGLSCAAPAGGPASLLEPDLWPFDAIMQPHRPEGWRSPLVGARFHGAHLQPQTALRARIDAWRRTHGIAAGTPPAEATLSPEGFGRETAALEATMRTLLPLRRHQSVVGAGVWPQGETEPVSVAELLAWVGRSSHRLRGLTAHERPVTCAWPVGCALFSASSLLVMLQGSLVALVGCTVAVVLVLASLAAATWAQRRRVRQAEQRVQATLKVLRSLHRRLVSLPDAAPPDDFLAELVVVLAIGRVLDGQLDPADDASFHLEWNVRSLLRRTLGRELTLDPSLEDRCCDQVLRRAASPCRVAVPALWLEVLRR